MFPERLRPPCHRQTESRRDAKRPAWRVLGERWDRPASAADEAIDAIRRVAAADVPVFPHPYLTEGTRSASPTVRSRRGGILISTKPEGLLVVSIELLQRSVAVEWSRRRSAGSLSGPRLTLADRRGRADARLRVIPRVAVALLWLLGAVTTSAQGLSYLPSFGMSVAYDDNLYHRPAGEGDMIVRFSPRLDAAYESGRLAITSRYALDADRFARHPELTTAHGRQEAALDARYDASRRLLVTGMAAFSETQTPSDLNEVTALTPGRARARRLVLGPSATYDVGSRTDASVGYTATLETLQGGVSVTTQNATAALEHRRSAASSLRVSTSISGFSSPASVERPGRSRPSGRAR